jgi:hypothetical protein
MSNVPIPGIQVHADSASIEKHFTVAGPHFGKVMECLEAGGKGFGLAERGNTSADDANGGFTGRNDCIQRSLRRNRTPSGAHIDLKPDLVLVGYQVL